MSKKRLIQESKLMFKTNYYWFCVYYRASSSFILEERSNGKRYTVNTKMELYTQITESSCREHLIIFLNEMFICRKQMFSAHLICTACALCLYRLSCSFFDFLLFLKCPFVRAIVFTLDKY